jgi:hypothetical protein
MINNTCPFLQLEKIENLDLNKDHKKTLYYLNFNNYTPTQSFRLESIFKTNCWNNTFVLVINTCI